VSKKPCLNCGEDCDILPVQLGDIFTLTLLRVCGPECLFILTYDYLYSIGYHKGFRSSLYEQQNEEDKSERDKYVKEVTDESLRMLREHLAANSDLLSRPMPECLMKVFSDAPPLPMNSTKMVKFARPSKEQRIAWQKKRVRALRKDLKESLHELQVLENE